MNYLDSKKFLNAHFSSQVFELIIPPLQYLDGRPPRLPRKSSKHYNLRADTKFYFQTAFQELSTNAESGKFRVEIIVNNGQDRLGSADLDNYCKAILDGITSTQKVWKDDRQVDEVLITRLYVKESSSSIPLKVQKL